MIKVFENLKNNSQMKIDLKYFPFFVIIFLTFLNSFFNSIASELSLSSQFTTFLFNPNDFMADLIKSALSYPGPEIKNYQRWNIIYQEYYNYYQAQSEGVRSPGQPTNLHGTPLMVDYFIMARFFLAKLNLQIFFFLNQIIWIIPLFLVVYLYLKDKWLSLVTIVTILLSYPFLFALTRGHIPAGIAGVCLITAIILSYEKSAPAALILCVIVAINIRPNALPFAFLPFLTWNFRQAAKITSCIIFGACALFVSLFYLANYLYSPYTLANFTNAVGIYHEIYVVGDAGLAYGSSLLGALKLLFKIFDIDYSIYFLEKSILIAALCSYFIWFVLINLGKLRKFSALLVLVSLYTVSTSVFGDYHLLAFAGLLIIYARELRRAPFVDASSIVLVLLLALILSPKNYIFFVGASLQIILNPLILCGVLVIVARELRSKEVSGELPIE